MDAGGTHDASMAGPTPAASWRRDRGAELLVVVATALAYLPSLSGRFIWNDGDYVTAPGLRPLAGLARIWTQPGATQQYYPLLHSLFWVEHRLWGDHPLGYHLLNVALHAGAAVLFGLMLRRLAVPGPWLGALLFAVHPVHVESVAWITEQKNTLSLVLYLGAALLYLDFDASRRPRTYAGAFTLFVLALLAKTVTATLPAALLVVLWWRRGRIRGRADVLPLLPWLVVGAAAGVFSSWVERGYGGADGTDFSLSWAGRLVVAGRALWFYAGQLVWPFRLNFIYPRWPVNPAAATSWIAPLAAVALAAALWSVRRWSRAPLAVLLLFAGSLFPVLGFVNLYGSLYSWVWDHWQYLADLAPLALAGALLVRLWAGPAGRVALGALAVLLGALSWAHCAMFHDDQALYRATLARNPGAWMAHYNLGLLLQDLPGGRAAAMEEFEAALAAKPDHANAHTALGVLLAQNPSRLSEAIAHFRTAVRLAPAVARNHSNLGSALVQVPGAQAEALAECAEALRLDPGIAEAHDSYANALAAFPARRAERLAEYEAALRLDPDLALAHYNLGIALAEDPTQRSAAAAQFAAAAKLRPADPDVHYNLGLMLVADPDRQAEAIAEFETAITLNPNSFSAHYCLGLALAKQAGRRSDALAQLEEAARLRPDLGEVQTEIRRLRESPP